MADFLQVTRVPAPEFGGEFVFIEQHENDKHDPNWNFRAEIAPKAIEPKKLDRLLKSMVSKKNPLVESDKPSAPVGLLGWTGWLTERGIAAYDSYERKRAGLKGRPTG